MSEWQPITTAPKDGTYVLLWAGVDHQLGLWFDGIYYGGGDGRWETLDGTVLEDEWEPTHWMPLPDPPALAKAVGGK